MATGFAGGATSAGANLSGYFLSKKSIDLLQKELNQHNLTMEKLSLISDSAYLKKAIRLRPTLDQLSKLCEEEFLKLIVTVETLVSLALKGNHAQINKTINLQTNPVIKNLLDQLPIFQNLSVELLNALLQTLTQIIKQLDSIWDCIKAFVNHLACPELSLKAMLLSSLTVASRSAKGIASEAAGVGAAFKGTPMAMSKAARFGAGVLTVGFIVIDIIHMVHICKETGETPTVKQLREMATHLEKELQLDLSI